MTCIVGVEFGDKAVIAGDFLGSNGHTKNINMQSKVFEHSGMIFGYTSSFRFGQVLECMLDDNTLYPPTNSNDTYSWLIRNFIPKLKKTLEENDCNAGVALICINNQIWQLHSDFSVLRNENGVSSVGSGEYHASAAIAAIFNFDKSKKEKFDNKILEIAYKVTSDMVTSVSNKYNYILG